MNITESELESSKSLRMRKSQRFHQGRPRSAAVKTTESGNSVNGHTPHSKVTVRNIATSDSNTVPQKKFTSVMLALIEKSRGGDDLSKDIKNFKMEAAKLRSQSGLKSLNVDNLLQCMEILENIIKKGVEEGSVVPSDDDTEKELIFKKGKPDIEVEASLASLFILLFAHLDSKISVLDLIELIVHLTTRKIRAIIYPAYNKKGSANKNVTPKKNSKIIHKFLTTLSYNISEILVLLSEFVNNKYLSDYLIFNVITLGILSLCTSVQEIQLASMKLLVSLFPKYKNYQALILDEIFESFVNDNYFQYPFKLISDGNIQLFTALLLQLVGSSFDFSAATTISGLIPSENLIFEKWQSAQFTTYNILYSFMQRIIKPEGKNYKVLFDKFILDLLVLLSKPEWPLSEFFLTILGNLSVHNFFKPSDTSFRLVCLDCINFIAAALKKLKSVRKPNQTLQQILSPFLNNNEFAAKQTDGGSMLHLAQEIILTYLRELSKKNIVASSVMHFYLVKWFQSNNEIINSLWRKFSNDNETYIETLQTSQIDFQHIMFNFELLNRSEDSQFNGDLVKEIVQHLFFDSMLFKNYSLYVSCIVKGLKDKTWSIRSKCLKGITNIIESDPDIVNPEFSKTVKILLIDGSAQVRDSAVELIGKLVLVKPELLSTYYQPFISRILDTSINVRRRVVKVIIELSTMFTSHPQIPELLVKLICRISDEESIQNIVLEFFKKFWFTPVDESDYDTLIKRIANMIECITLFNQMNINCFHELFLKLFRRQNLDGSYDAPPKEVLASSKQLIHSLVETIIELEKYRTKPQHLIASLVLLNIFAKYQSDQLIPHAVTLQEYMLIRYSTRLDGKIISYIVQALSEVLPRMKDVKFSLLEKMETDLIKLIFHESPDSSVIICCVSCLVEVMNRTKHYHLIRDSFFKFYEFIKYTKDAMEKHKDFMSVAGMIKSSLNRSIFVVGLFTMHFNFNDAIISGNKFSKNFEREVSEVLLHFLKLDSPETELFILRAVGFVCSRYSDLLLESKIKNLYNQILCASDSSVLSKIKVLDSLRNFLAHEDEKLSYQNKLISSYKNKDKIKESQDDFLGRASTVIQNYLGAVLENLFDCNLMVRQSAFKVVQLILNQGLIEPLQLVPYLVTICTEEDETLRQMAERHLLDIETKYPGYCYIKVQIAIHMSYKFQCSLNASQEFRGFRYSKDNIDPKALNSFLYALMKTKQQKHSFLQTLIKQFDEHSKVNVHQLQYMVDNLAYLPYRVIEEPLFVIFQIDMILSVCGPNMLLMFRENLLEGYKSRNENVSSEEENSENEQRLLEHLPEDTTPLRECVRASIGCLLLGRLKQHLKAMYHINFEMIKHYSPSDANKTYERSAVKKHNLGCFTPPSIIKKLSIKDSIIDNSSLVQVYLEIKKLTYTLDAEDFREVRRSSVCAKYEKTMTEPMKSTHHKDIKRSEVKKISCSNQCRQQSSETRECTSGNDNQENNGQRIVKNYIKEPLALRKAVSNNSTREHSAIMGINISDDIQINDKVRKATDKRTSSAQTPKRKRKSSSLEVDCVEFHHGSIGKQQSASWDHKIRNAIAASISSVKIAKNNRKASSSKTDCDELQLVPTEGPQPSHSWDNTESIKNKSDYSCKTPRGKRKVNRSKADCVGLQLNLKNGKQQSFPTVTTSRISDKTENAKDTDSSIKTPRGKRKVNSLKADYAELWNGPTCEQKPPCSLDDTEGVNNVRNKTTTRNLSGKTPRGKRKANCLGAHGPGLKNSLLCEQPSCSWDDTESVNNIRNTTTPRNLSGKRNADCADLQNSSVCEQQTSCTSDDIESVDKIRNTSRNPSGKTPGVKKKANHVLGLKMDSNNPVHQ